jgi:hypothetical protein
LGYFRNFHKAVQSNYPVGENLPNPVTLTGCGKDLGIYVRRPKNVLKPKPIAKKSAKETVGPN